jgi:phosphoglycerate dehydrogenase-like enzyme
VPDPLVWLPFDPAELGEVPGGLRYEVVDPTEHVPDSVTDVAFYVPPYDMGPRIGEVLPRMTSLQVIQTMSAGVDNVRGSVPPGVTLCNGRGIHDTSTAELALALTLSSLRGLPRFVRQQDAGEWRAGFEESLADKRVLLVGHGAIGSAIEERLLPFECEVVRVARRARDGVHAIDELPSLVPAADVVILIVPLTEQTRGLVDWAFLAALPDGAIVVNVARGAIVQTDALLAELERGRLSAFLDVTEPEPLPPGHPLWQAPNVVITPHVGGGTSGWQRRGYRLVREQLRRYAAGEPLLNVITDGF